MIAKIVLLCGVVAVASAGVLLNGLQTPANTNLFVQSPQIAYSAPVTYTSHVVGLNNQIANVGLNQNAVVRTIPQSVVAPVSIIGQRVLQTVEPVEQHGYSIRY